MENLAIYVFTFLLLLGVIKIIEYFEEESRRKRSNLTEEEYKRCKNLERRIDNERYSMGDDEEYLKVFKKLKLSGWDDDDIEDLIKDGKKMNWTEVELTEYLRGFIDLLEDNEDFEDKWLDLIRNDNKGRAAD
ncbi:MAG: hypothetical protein JRI32_01660 [Deltaproteobacteria bacterium]|nr:hypothetical protein [Deltaproteobacteria bacterium]